PGAYGVDALGDAPRELADRPVAYRREQRVAVGEVAIGGVGHDADPARDLAEHDGVRAAGSRELVARLDERGPNRAAVGNHDRQLSGQCPLVVRMVGDMTTTTEQPYATGETRANIERALAEAGKRIDALEPADLALLEDFHSLGRFATVALVDLAQIAQ